MKVVNKVSQEPAILKQWFFPVLTLMTLTGNIFLVIT